MPIEGSHATKQIPQTDPQPFGNLLDVNQRQVPNATLNTGVVGPMKAASLRSFFMFFGMRGCSDFVTELRTLVFLLTSAAVRKYSVAQSARRIRRGATDSLIRL